MPYESEGAGLREEKKWFSQEDEQLINRLNHPTFTADHIRDVLNNAGDSTSMALVCGFLEAVGCMNTVPTEELLYQDARKKRMIEDIEEVLDSEEYLYLSDGSEIDMDYDLSLLYPKIVEQAQKNLTSNDAYILAYRDAIVQAICKVVSEALVK